MSAPFLFNVFLKLLNKIHSVDSPLWGKYSTLHTLYDSIKKLASKFNVTQKTHLQIFISNSYQDL